MNMTIGRIVHLGCLALVILFDQFSRNIFRNEKKAFEQDHKTRLIVNDAVYAGFLEKMDESQKIFYDITSYSTVKR